MLLRLFIETPGIGEIHFSSPGSLCVWGAHFCAWLPFCGQREVTAGRVGSVGPGGRMCVWWRGGYHGHWRDSRIVPWKMSSMRVNNWGELVASKNAGRGRTPSVHNSSRWTDIWTYSCCLYNAITLGHWWFKVLLFLWLDPLKKGDSLWLFYRKNTKAWESANGVWNSRAIYNEVTFQVPADLNVTLPKCQLSMSRRAWL